MRYLNPLAFAILSICSCAARSGPAEVCLTAFEKAEQERQVAPVRGPDLAVTGTGRLYFHTAPDKGCQLKDTFVIVGDRVEAYAEYGEFTRVIYWSPVTGAGTAGWVLSARLAEPRSSMAFARFSLENAR